MRNILAVTCMMFLTACSVMPAPEVHVEANPTSLGYEPCESKTKEIVKKYLLTALNYPERSAHRHMYLDTMDAEFRLAISASSPYERGLCNIAYYYEQQQILVAIE